jgi:uncharacterized membrane protein HdeD (DUF308 family)
MAITPSAMGAAGLPMTRAEMLAQNWWALVLRGVAALVFGVITFLWPGLTLGTLVLLFGIYALVDGVFGVISAIRAATHRSRWGLLLLEGVVSILAGLIALFMPAVTVIVAIWVMAAWALITGVLMLAAGFGLQRAHGNWWLGIGGAISIIWGVLLAVFPIAGAVVLTLWLGAYAVIFGFAMIALGLRLHARRGII